MRGLSGLVLVAIFGVLPHLLAGAAPCDTVEYQDSGCENTEDEIALIQVSNSREGFWAEAEAEVIASSGKEATAAPSGDILEALDDLAAKASGKAKEIDALAGDAGGSKATAASSGDIPEDNLAAKASGKAKEIDALAGEVISELATGAEAAETKPGPAMLMQGAGVAGLTTGGGKAATAVEKSAVADGAMALQKREAAERATAHASEELLTLAEGARQAKTATEKAASALADSLSTVAFEAQRATGATGKAISAVREQLTQDETALSNLQSAQAESTAIFEAAKAQSAALLEAMQAVKAPASIQDTQQRGEAEGLALLQSLESAPGKAEGLALLQSVSHAAAVLTELAAQHPGTSAYLWWMSVIITGSVLSALVSVPAYLAFEDGRKGNPAKVPRGPPQNFDALIRSGYLGSAEAVRGHRGAVNALNAMPACPLY